MEALAAADVIVAMGGPMNIYQYRNFPWLKQERLAFEQAFRSGKKLIGICLGAQILADMLGARVVQNLEREIGWMPVNFTSEARARLDSLPHSQTVLHWHGDTFELPPSCVRLASSEACENQGFIFENRVLALQFHLEMTAASVRDIIENCRGELQSGPFVHEEARILGDGPAHFQNCEKILGGLLDNFLA